MDPNLIRLDSTVREFLEAAASVAGTNISTVLVSTLGVRPIAAYPEAAKFFGRVSHQTAAVVEKLDQQFRTANPGSQLVFRAEYVGYRRFDQRQPSGTKSIRSQVYASLLPRRDLVRVVLPLDPHDYSDVVGVTNLSDKGHHGVGNVAFDAHTIEDAETIMRVFRTWLGALHPG